MYWETFFDFIKVFCAYSVLVIWVPSLALKHVVAGMNIIKRFTIYIVTGNLYIIMFMFLLGYLRLVNRFFILIFFIAGIFIIRKLTVKRLKDKQPAAFLSVAEIGYLFAGEYGVKNFLKNKLGFIVHKFRLLYCELFYHKKIEWIFFIIIIVSNLFYYGNHTMEYVSYGAYDEEVHLYWIQSMIGGKIFPSGMYPHGFHNILACISVLFDIDAILIIRVIGMVSVTFIMTMLYLGMRSIMNYKYAVVFSFFIFTFCNMYSVEAYHRYQFAIPQEYAMIFLLPMAVFLFEYLQNKKKSSLILFGVSFSLTLLIHFYTTIIAGFFCIAAGIVYLLRIIKKKMLLPLLIAGVLSTIVALLPLGVGFLFGYQFEQSMFWAVSVMEKEVETPSSPEDDIGADTSEDGQTGLIKPEKNKAFDFEAVKKETVRIFEKYVFTDISYFIGLAALLIFLVLYFICCLVLRRTKEQQRMQLTIVVFAVLLVGLLLMRPFGIKNIMEEKRVSIFLSYYTPFLLAMPFEFIHRLICHFPKTAKLYSGFLCLMAFEVTGLMSESGNARGAIPYYYFQATGTMKAMLRIMDTYEDFTWTVISPVNDSSVVMNSGFHVELNEFILKMEDWDDKTVFHIPTKYIFYVVEKYPLDFYGIFVYPGDKALDMKNRFPVSLESALSHLPNDTGSNINYNDYRYELMSRASYWAQFYQESHPFEMNIYYEDEEVVVYRIVQDTYSLENLTVNYRSVLEE